MKQPHSQSLGWIEIWRDQRQLPLVSEATPAQFQKRGVEVDISIGTRRVVLFRRCSKYAPNQLKGVHSPSHRCHLHLCDWFAGPTWLPILVSLCVFVGNRPPMQCTVNFTGSSSTVLYQSCLTASTLTLRPSSPADIPVFVDSCISGAPFFVQKAFKSRRLRDIFINRYRVVLPYSSFLITSLWSSGDFGEMSHLKRQLVTVLFIDVN